MQYNFSRFNLAHSFLAAAATVATLVIIQPTVLAAKSPTEIGQVAEKVTVQINAQEEDSWGGSGVIVGRQGNTYTVLTCIHVLESNKFKGVNLTDLSVRTYDGQVYPLTIVKKLGTVDNPDLAIVSFTSSTSYPLATPGNSDQTKPGANIYVYGYPAKVNKIKEARTYEFVTGVVKERPSRGYPKFEAYTLRYTAPTLGGMSGGPVFDVDGRVIGIHGQGDQATLDGGIRLKTGINAGVPINIYEKVRSQIALNIPSAPVDNTPSTDNPEARLNNPQSAGDYYAKGVVQDRPGNSSKAIDAYTQAIKRDPNYADAYYRRGNARLDQNDKQGAIADYTQAINLKPDYANAYFQRGVIRYNDGDQQAALEDFNQYVSLAPKDAQGYYSRGVIRRALGDIQGTLADFDQIVSLVPNDPSAYYNRGVIRRDLGDPQGTLTDFDQVVRLVPQDPSAYYNRGVMRRDLGDRQGAIQDLQTSANIYQQQGNTNQYQKAMQVIQRIQASPDIPKPQEAAPARDSGQPTPDTPPSGEATPAEDPGW